jgi:hypothetical protein
VRWWDREKKTTVVSKKQFFLEKQQTPSSPVPTLGNRRGFWTISLHTDPLKYDSPEKSWALGSHSHATRGSAGLYSAPGSVCRARDHHRASLTFHVLSHMAATTQGRRAPASAFYNSRLPVHNTLSNLENGAWDGGVVGWEGLQRSKSRPTRLPLEQAKPPSNHFRSS